MTMQVQRGYRYQNNYSNTRKTGTKEILQRLKNRVKRSFVNQTPKTTPVLPKSTDFTTPVINLVGINKGWKNDAEKTIFEHCLDGAMTEITSDEQIVKIKKADIIKQKAKKFVFATGKAIKKFFKYALPLAAFAFIGYIGANVFKPSSNNYHNFVYVPDTAINAVDTTGATYIDCTGGDTIDSPAIQVNSEMKSVKELQKGSKHTVSRGESLWQIAKKQYKNAGYKKVSNNKIANFVKETVKLNNLKNPDKIKIGQTLTLPHIDVKA